MKHVLYCLLLFFTNPIFGQSTFTLSGYVRDAQTGETLIAANVINLENPVEGTTTNTYGFYSLTLPEGKYKIAFSYLGFQDQAFELDLSKNIELNVDMAEGVTMEEVVISAEKDGSSFPFTSPHVQLVGDISRPLRTQQSAAR